MLNANDAVIPRKMHTISRDALRAIIFSNKCVFKKLRNCTNTLLSISTSPVVLASIKKSLSKNLTPTRLATPFTTALSGRELCSTHTAIPAIGSAGIAIARKSIAAVFTNIYTTNGFTVYANFCNSVVRFCVLFICLFTFFVPIKLSIPFKELYL